MYLKKSCFPDITCPHCKQGLEIEWGTEYGDPSFGEHTVKCICCSKNIEFSVFPVYTVVGACNTPKG